jgi:N-acyl-phosphatidylethanolamine-hydrolysing phospholipase D
MSALKINVNWIGGATFILGIGDLKIACDPVLCEKGTIQDYSWFKSERLEAPIYQDIDFEDIDLWLITHDHEDHLDEQGLWKIQDTIPINCTKQSIEKLKARGLRNYFHLAWHKVQKYEFKGYCVMVEAIPAIHGVNPLSAFFAGNVNGYYITVMKDSDIKRVYITGDTVYKKKVIQAFKSKPIQKPIDLMIPFMGAAKQGTWLMTLTLNASMLAKMIEKLNPHKVVPVHFGTFNHYNEPISEVEKLNDPRIIIMKPGDTIELPC